MQVVNIIWTFTQLCFDQLELEQMSGLTWVKDVTVTNCQDCKTKFTVRLRKELSHISFSYLNIISYLLIVHVYLKLGVKAWTQFISRAY